MMYCAFFDRSGRRRRRVFRMNRDQLVCYIYRSHREMNVPLLPAQANYLIEHAELLRRMQLLDLVPGKRNVSERVAMKGDLAGRLAHELPMQRVAITQNQHIGHGVGCGRGRLALARAKRSSAHRGRQHCDVNSSMKQGNECADTTRSRVAGRSPRHGCVPSVRKSGPRLGVADTADSSLAESFTWKPHE